MIAHFLDHPHKNKEDLVEWYFEYMQEGVYFTLRPSSQEYIQYEKEDPPVDQRTEDIYTKVAQEVIYEYS